MKNFENRIFSIIEHFKIKFAKQHRLKLIFKILFLNGFSVRIAFLCVV